jgi:hypothetical protein
MKEQVKMSKTSRISNIKIWKKIFYKENNDEEREMLLIENGK